VHEGLDVPADDLTINGISTVALDLQKDDQEQFS